MDTVSGFVNDLFAPGTNSRTGIGRIAINYLCAATFIPISGLMPIPGKGDDRV
jgi:hypothetical protein